MSKIYQIVQGVGAVLLLVGAMLQITRWDFSPYIYNSPNNRNIHILIMLYAEKYLGKPQFSPNANEI